MIRFRPFRNGDAPALARLWSSQPPMRGRLQPLGPMALEQAVFSKLCFDHAGLILALEGDEPVGFVHAGFGPDAAGQRIDRGHGTIAMLQAAARPDADAIGRSLLERAEAYLLGYRPAEGAGSCASHPTAEAGAFGWAVNEAASHGSCRVQAAGCGACAPFYLGLYGGAELPGWLVGDELPIRVCLAAGYERAATRVIWHLPLARFKSPMSRQVLQWKRTCQVAPDYSARQTTWWEACATCHTESTCFSVASRGHGDCGNATFRFLDDYRPQWGQRTIGLVDVQAAAALRRQGLATFFLAECFKQLQIQGFEAVEAHADETDIPLTGLLRKLGFQEVDRGLVLRRS